MRTINSLALLLFALVACDRSKASSSNTTTESTAAAKPAPAPEKADPWAALVKEPKFRQPTSPDPEKGDFTLEEATDGLPPGKVLTATIETGKGTLRCTLDLRSPQTVANFVGLARGLRPFWDESEGKWVKRPLYEGSTFHRVIPGFMIQGGDNLNSGAGGVGYVVDDEIHKSHKHDRAGQLCMANRGPNTNGGQFFITDGAASHLDGGYTIFGTCEPASVIHTIARVPTGARNRPVEPVRIKKVTIDRK